MINLVLRSLIYPCLLALVFLCVCERAHGDGKPSSDQQQTRPTTRQYNDRLPPVLPGEEVVTETGQKMRVWSSSGPVPINPQPTPQQLPSGVGGAGVGVIVDGRDRYGPPPPPRDGLLRK